jgi:hypothetical protein
MIILLFLSNLTSINLTLLLGTTITRVFLWCVWMHRMFRSNGEVMYLRSCERYPREIHLDLVTELRRNHGWSWFLICCLARLKVFVELWRKYFLNFNEITRKVLALALNLSFIKEFEEVIHIKCLVLKESL